MFTDSPMTPPEEAADIAWEMYAAELSEFSRQVKAGVPHDRLRAQHETVLRAEGRWKRAYAALTDPTPPSEEAASAQLTCEGLLLVTAVAAFIGLFLPDLQVNFWPLAITFVVLLALGGWATHFLGRLGQHIGRRM